MSSSELEGASTQSMSDLRKQKFMLEGIWWVITVAIIMLFLRPIHRHAPSFPYMWENALYIIVFITLGRYLFQLKYSLWGRWQYLKLALIFLSIPFIFYLVSTVNAFVVYLDDHLIDDVLKHLDAQRYQEMERYIRTEYIFFGVASVITASMMPIRLVISIWRQRNRGEV